MALRRTLLSAGRQILGEAPAAAAFARIAGVPEGLTLVATRDYARGVGKSVRKPTGGRSVSAVDDPWEEVKDQTTGQAYWWNVQTNETTALGAPKPAGGAPPPMQQQPAAPPQSMMGSFGSMMAEGMAFGAGSAIAHRAVGSMFGGGGGYGGGDAPAGQPPAPGAPPTDQPPASGGGMFADDTEFDNDDDGGWGDGDGGGGGFFDGFDSE
eukprot:CAMPEP_0197575818 /NCGR_PEP_ID=MMETSP1326-20131121/1071_1 /TAXON_ID=1155430 /ORGANISM="Genus nov. species nov., Strain RCC2288" /LENGTH=209 /DNA_ID=CAMNT_0043138643 /DNA_START=174 /DNA_END=803 /DNA_ORIENTATION=+